MKKLLLFISVLMVSAAICNAQSGFFAGAQIGYTKGGDVNESKLGFGAQAGMNINDNLSLELAWNKFSDEKEVENFLVIEGDANVIAGTLRAGIPLSDTLKIYGGVGINYLMIDINIKISSTGRSLIEEMAAYYGIPVEEAMSSSVLDTGTIETDDTVGYHICGGFAADIMENIQLFGEYRYSFGKIKGKGIDEDYNYGIIRAGANLLF